MSAEFTRCGPPVLRAHRLGAQPRDAAARLPAHRDRQRRGPARGDGRGAGLGERRRGLLRHGLAHAAVDPARRRGVSQDLRDWVNSGLMTFFFFVVGLEARREFDMGELRERRRLALPLAGRPRRHGRAGRDLPGLQRRPARPRTAGAPRCRPTRRSRSGCSRWSGRAFPDRLRAFMLTVAVVDDLVALVVIASAYTGHLALVGAR